MHFGKLCHSLPAPAFNFVVPLLLCGGRREAADVSCLPTVPQSPFNPREFVPKVTRWRIKQETGIESNSLLSSE